MGGEPLKFGTSGWRAVIAEEFTYGNARRAVAGIASVLEKEHAGGLLLIGFDTRFMADAFAREAALLLLERGFRVALSVRPIPTPVLSFETIRRKAAGALNFTASHNPPKYLGLKFSSGNGAPALPEVTDRIEREIRKIDEVEPPKDGKPETFDAAPPYLDALSKFGDAASLSGFPVALDFRFGTSAGYLDAFFERAGAKVSKIHADPDPLFGGQSPQCSARELAELGEVVRKTGAALGLATDGDADRFGVLDAGARYVGANAILPLLAWDIYKNGRSERGIARSVATTQALDAIAKKFGVELHETPVGFKYIGELLLEGKIAIGGEESAGLTVEGHVPDKDGILADLLVAHAVRGSGKSLAELRAELEREIGPYFSDRIDLPITEGEKRRLAELRAHPPEKLGARRVVGVDTIDGLKLLLDGDAWVLWRESGTEPVARFYAEARSKKDLDGLLSDGRRVLQE